MSHTLEYSNQVVVPRRSRMALAALAVGALGMPSVYCIFCVLDRQGVDPLVTGLLVIVLYLSFSVTGVVMGLVAIKRIAASRGRLRGYGYGIAGMAASVVMPLLFLWGMGKLFH